MRDCGRLSCDLLTIGQYLRPSLRHLPVRRYYHPDEFADLKRRGEALGFAHVESGPLVRSSYHASSRKRRPKPCIWRDNRRRGRPFLRGGCMSTTMTIDAKTRQADGNAARHGKRDRGVFGRRGQLAARQGSLRGLGDKAIAVTAVSPSLPQAELEEAQEVAKRIGIEHRLVNSGRNGQPAVRRQP